MRDVLITADRDGAYILTLRQNQVVVTRCRILIYHEIGGVVSNWIVNGVTE
jgi:hypothetical protein